MKVPLIFTGVIMQIRDCSPQAHMLNTLSSVGDSSCRAVETSREMSYQENAGHWGGIHECWTLLLATSGSFSLLFVHNGMDSSAWLPTLCFGGMIDLKQ